MFCISETKKKQGRFCCAFNCTNEPIVKKGGLCHKHYRRKLRIEDPVQVRYADFKQNALKRNKDFSITIKQFRDFCQRENYIIKKGQRGQNATIDRIKNKYGYHIWNIQKITNKANAKKGTSDGYVEREDLPF